MKCKNVKKYTATLGTALIFLLAGCAGNPHQRPTPAEESPEALEQTRPTDRQGADAEPNEAVEEEPKSTPDSEAEQSAPSEPEDEQTAEHPASTPGQEGGQPDEQDYDVTDEVYNETFDQVEATIDELNRIIQDRNFDAWQDKLTERYIETFSSPERLEELSRTPVLERNNIELSSLRDYFRWVVVPSRSNARLDDLNFHGANRVEAIMEVRGQRVTLYELRRVDGSWKVDVF